MQAKGTSNTVTLFFHFLPLNPSILPFLARNPKPQHSFKNSSSNNQNVGFLTNAIWRFLSFFPLPKDEILEMASKYFSFFYFAAPK